MERLTYAAQLWWGPQVSPKLVVDKVVPIVAGLQ